MPSPRLRWSLILLLAGGICGCGGPETTGPTHHPDDCMKATRLDALPAAIQACDAVVRAYPDDPRPRKDRALVWSLRGDEVRACADLNQALDLTETQPAGPTRTRMRSDLQISLRSCPGRGTPP